MDKDQLWKAALGELELSISKANFSTWLTNTFILEIDGDRVVIATPNTFTQSWLQNKYNQFILKALQNCSDQPINKIEYRVISTNAGHKIPGAIHDINAIDDSVVESIAHKKTSRAPTKFGLNPNYTFETFVVGKGNELAQAACIAAAENPGTSYNPVFIYGGVGLGKTHLLQAVGNEFLKKHPQGKVLYVSSEQFTNEYISSVQKGEGKKFKDIYRSVDLLLIDDIQFLAGKEATQEEFFHTFNALHQNQKQIVLTSDRPPKGLTTLEDRLRSRFEMGMIADVTSPDLETRVAILRQKSRNLPVTIPDPVFHQIASTIHGNVRELEGALNRLAAYHQLNKLPITLESAKSVLASMLVGGSKKALTPKKIVSAVASYYEIKVDELTGSCRRKNLVTPRQIAMYLMREEIKASYPNIGQELGGRDHTTAMHACERVARMLDEDERVTQEISAIRERLYSS